MGHLDLGLLLQCRYLNQCSVDANVALNACVCLFSCHSKGMPADDFIRGTFTLVNSTKLTGSAINERVGYPIKGGMAAGGEMGRVRGI